MAPIDRFSTDSLLFFVLKIFSTRLFLLVFIVKFILLRSPKTLILLVTPLGVIVGGQVLSTVTIVLQVILSLVKSVILLLLI